MAVKSNLEAGTSKPFIELLLGLHPISVDIHLLKLNLGLVNNIRSFAMSVNNAGGFATSAVAIQQFESPFRLEDPLIVRRDLLANIWHSGVGSFDFLTVEVIV